MTRSRERRLWVEAHVEVGVRSEAMCITYQCLHRAPLREEARNGKEGKMTQSVDIGQALSPTTSVDTMGTQ